MQIKIRKAVNKDITELSSLEYRLSIESPYLRQYDNLGGCLCTMKMLIRTYTKKPRLFKVLMIDGVMCGFIRAYIERGCYYIGIGILSEYHRKGFGTLLIKNCIDTLSTNKPIKLLVDRANINAIKCYESCNFTITSEINSELTMEYNTQLSNT